MTTRFVKLIVALSLALGTCSALAVEGTVDSLAEAKAQVQQQPEKHILVFYKNYRS